MSHVLTAHNVKYRSAEENRERPIPRGMQQFVMQSITSRMWLQEQAFIPGSPIKDILFPFLRWSL
jgi:hypothetical protein